MAVLICEEEEGVEVGRESLVPVKRKPGRPRKLPSPTVEPVSGVPSPGPEPVSAVVGTPPSPPLVEPVEPVEPVIDKVVAVVGEEEDLKLQRPLPFECVSSVGRVSRRR